jgi:hypothetical protein
VAKKKVDMRRVVIAGLEAAIEEAKGSSSPAKAKNRQPAGKKRGLPAGRALLIGAGLVTAGRLAAASRGREMLESLRDRLTADDDELPDDELPDEDDLPEDELDEDELPDDEFDDEDELPDDDEEEEAA